MQERSVEGAFVVAKNPEAETSLPYLVFVPFDGGLWLKARETWPRSSRVYCHRLGPRDIAALDLAALTVLERVDVLSCQRRGPVLDIVLERAQNRRAQFVFTQARGRAMIFWQTAKSAANARPGLRVAQRPTRALDKIIIDTRERYGYGFKGREVPTERGALRAGDYLAVAGNATVAVVERKTMDDFCASLVDGSLGFAMADLARIGTAAVVVEGTYTQLLRRGFVDGAWLGELVARLHVRYANVPIVFVETRALGERWTFDYFKAAAAENVGAVAVVPTQDAPVRKPATRRRRGASKTDAAPADDTAAREPERSPS